MFEEYLGIKVRQGSHGQQDRDVVREVILNDGYKLEIRKIRNDAKSFVIDIGAHIGTFARAWHDRDPFASIVCVEVCPENLPILHANTDAIARVECAACTYEAGEIRLLNSIKVDGTATGGSIVVKEGQMTTYGNLYWLDARPIRKITLEEIMVENGFPRIDCLKLDCEGSEFSILQNATCLDRVGFICGEYHGRDKWEDLVHTKFSNWGYAHLCTSGELGIFHLQNPEWDWSSPRPRPKDYGSSSGLPA